MNRFTFFLWLVTVMAAAPLSIQALELAEGGDRYPDIRLANCAISLDGISGWPLESDRLPVVLSQLSPPAGESMSRRGSFNWHRYLGYAVLAGAVSSSITGTVILNKYENNEEPDSFLKHTHRAQGIATGALSITNSVLGYINYFKLMNEPAGKGKRLTHLILSSIASVGISASAILGVKAREDYKEANSYQDVSAGGTHRTASFTAAGVILVSTIVIIW